MPWSYRTMVVLLNTLRTPMTDIEQALHVLKAGKLVAIPTETVYGLGADANHPEAVERVYTAKNRPAHNPLIIHLAKGEAIQSWAIDIPKSAWILAEACWPGPLTILLQKHPHVSKRITAGQETVALRVPNHPITLALLECFQGGIVAPSANPYGYLSPTTTEHVRQSLGSKVDYILEGGPCTIGIESTIVYLLGDQPIIMREGFFSAHILSDILKKEVLSKQEAVQHGLLHLQTPGSALSHYAPTKPLYLFNQKALEETIKRLLQQDRHCGILSFKEKPKNVAIPSENWRQIPDNPTDYARLLYDYLHQLDNSSIDAILVENPPNTEAWLAIVDRLKRAASRLT